MCEFFEINALEFEKRSREGDMAGFYQHMERLDVTGNRSSPRRTPKTRTATCCEIPRSSSSDGPGSPPRISAPKSPTLNLRMIEQAKQCPTCVPLGGIPSRFKAEEAIRGTTIRKAAGPNGGAS